MSRLFVRTVAVAAALTFGACAAQDSDAPDTSATTMGLLSGSPRDGSTLMGDPDLPVNAGQTIDLATLGYDRGDPESPVRMLELSDYGCGYCRKFHMETFPTLLSQFVETGKVEWKFMPFITGMFDNSLAATEAAECALDQSREVFAQLNERLWTDQPDWKRSSEPEAVVRTMASDAGVDLGEFDACLADDRRIDRIAAATALAQRAGVRGTPTFFIMGYPPLQGALPTESFVQVLTQVHADVIKGDGS
jgi:protein-disulfide isomerase